MRIGWSRRRAKETAEAEAVSRSTWAQPCRASLQLQPGPRAAAIPNIAASRRRNMLCCWKLEDDSSADIVWYQARLQPSRRRDKRDGSIMAGMLAAAELAKEARIPPYPPSAVDNVCPARSAHIRHRIVTDWYADLAYLLVPSPNSRAPRLQSSRWPVFWYTATSMGSVRVPLSPMQHTFHSSPPRPRHWLHCIHT